MKIDIITKSVVERIVKNEIRELENRFYKHLDKQRKKILELENKINRKTKPLKAIRKNEK